MKNWHINVSVYSMWLQGCWREDLRHEGLNWAQDLSIFDQLRIHVGVVVHHLPEEREQVSSIVCSKGNTGKPLSKINKINQLRHLLGSEEPFKITSQEERDLICFRGLPIPGTDLQDTPAWGGQGVIQVPVGVPICLHHSLLQKGKLLLGVPIHSGCGHLCCQQRRRN